MKYYNLTKLDWFALNLLASWQKFDWLSPYLECCHSWSETFGVTWEHGALPDIVKIQVQHDNSLKTWEGRKKTRVNAKTNQNTH